MSTDPMEAARRIIDWNQRAAAMTALNVTVTAKLVADAIEVARALLAGPSSIGPCLPEKPTSAMITVMDAAMPRSGMSGAYFALHDYLIAAANARAKGETT